MWELFFGLLKLWLPRLSFLSLELKLLVICLVLFSYLIQVPYQNRILLLQKWYFILKWASFFAFIQCNGIDYLLQIKVFVLYDLFERIILCENLLTNGDCIRKLIFQHSQLLSQKVVLFLESAQNGTQFSIKW